MKIQIDFRSIIIELTTLIYTLFTSLIILLLWDRMSQPWVLLEGRALILMGMVVIYALYRAFPHPVTHIMRYIYPLTILGYWYGDTYEFCRLFPNLDHIFAHADLWLFGCQPSIEFSLLLPQKIWSELFNMGYFSYYLLIAIGVLAPLFTHRKDFERTAFIVVAAFFLYYLIYLFLPVAGPQYYFYAVGQDLIQHGHFPIIGDYFNYHTELGPSPGVEGFFRDLVDATQAEGERPTAAFPSSHVGMSTVLMILLYKNRRYLAALALPFYFFLCCATVYIQAHYLIDVIGGLVTAVLFYYLFDSVWRRYARPNPIMDGKWTK